MFQNKGERKQTGKKKGRNSSERFLPSNTSVTHVTFRGSGSFLQATEFMSCQSKNFKDWRQGPCRSLPLRPALQVLPPSPTQQVVTAAMGKSRHTLHPDIHLTVIYQVLAISTQYTNLGSNH
jgi:hypothetical protein